MSNTFDVIILGGGAAGSAAALTLLKRDPKLSIALIESSNYEKWRVGETLSPDAGRAFRELGIWDAFMATNPLTTQGTCAAWESDLIEENEFIFHPEGKGWHLNRVKFDQWMALQASKQGTDLRTKTRYVSHKNSDGATIITLESETGKYELQANMVIDSLGRMSSFGRNGHVEKRAFDRLSASISFFDVDTVESAIATYTLVEAVPTGWWYSAPLDNKRLIVAHMTDADLLKKEGLHSENQFLALLKKTNHTQHRTLQNKLIEPIRVLSAASLFSSTVHGNRWIAVGDSASTFDPLSSQGIYKAIRSGMFGAYAIFDESKQKGAGFRKYEKFISEEYKEYLNTRKEFYKKVKRWPNAEFWTRRH